MAITNAQQAKQIMNEGGPMKKIKGEVESLSITSTFPKNLT